MARYMLVAIDDNEKAESLKEKLDSWPGFQVVGMFYKATKFCECGVDDGLSPRENKFGMRIHTKCRRPKINSGQMPNNLLYSGIPSQFQHTRISVVEPHQTPAERHTQKVIDIKIQQYAESAAKYGRKRRRMRARR